MTESLNTEQKQESNSIHRQTQLYQNRAKNKEKQKWKRERHGEPTKKKLLLQAEILPKLRHPRYRVDNPKQEADKMMIERRRMAQVA